MAICGNSRRDSYPVGTLNGHGFHLIFLIANQDTRLDAAHAARLRKVFLSPLQFFARIVVNTSRAHHALAYAKSMCATGTFESW